MQKGKPNVDKVAGVDGDGVGSRYKLSLTCSITLAKANTLFDDQNFFSRD